MENTILQNISEATLKRIMTMDCCMPSDYLRIFKEEKELNDEMLSPEEENALQDDYHKASFLLEDVSSQDVVNLPLLRVNNNQSQKLLNEISRLTSELYSDHLTSAKNRKWLFQEYLVNGELPKKDGVMAFLDLNKFKRINDVHGHATGDNVLIFFTQFFGDLVRSEKLYRKYQFIRFAGDEFILILEEMSKKEMESFMKLAKTKIKTKMLKSKSNKRFRIDFSYGIDEFKRDEPIHMVVKNADKNMYDMKNIRKKPRKKE